MAEQREWKNGKPGKSECQKLKSLLVIQYILKHADADHPVTIADIQARHIPGFNARDVLFYRITSTKKTTHPQTAVDEFRAYLNNVRDLYESC